MKEKDLYIDFEDQKLVYYVEKENNTYGPIISGSHLSSNYLDDFWEKQKKLELTLRQQIIANEISPVFYYMTLLEMGPKDLAKRVKISYGKLKKLYKPEHFKNIKLNKIILFAKAFNIPVSSLFQTYIIKDSDRKKISIEQSTTENKLFYITKILLTKDE